jgi:hypothetical protein
MNTREWRCGECNTLLGVESDTRLQVRYKQAQYIIDGERFTVTAVCRCCHSVNQRSGGSDSRQTKTEVR